MDKKYHPREIHKAYVRTVEHAGNLEAKDLLEDFQDINQRFFGEKLETPIILIRSSGKALGKYVPRDDHGIVSQIWISPSVVAGGREATKSVLLHECVHQYCHEILETPESGYRGHGPTFAAECNRIGEELGIEEVGVKGRDGLPDCKYWPRIVQPNIQSEPGEDDDYESEEDEETADTVEDAPPAHPPTQEGEAMPIWEKIIHLAKNLQPATRNDTMRQIFKSLDRIDQLALLQQLNHDYNNPKSGE